MSLPIGALEWVRPKAWKLDWELRHGTEVIARMGSPSFFGTTIRASLGNDNYFLRKGGLRRPGATISRVGENGDLALLELDSLDRGTVTFTDGTAYALQRGDLDGTWEMSREGAVLFTVHRDARSKYPTGEVEVLAGDKRDAILMLLTWFMITTTD